MIRVAGHPFDVKHVAMLAQRDRAELTRSLALFPDEPSCGNVGSTASSKRWAIEHIGAVDPSASELLDLSRFVADGHAALFTYARRPDRDRWFLLGRERRIVGRPDEEALDDFNWCEGFWMAWATRDAEALALLVQTPIGVVEPWETFGRPFVSALQGLFTADPRTGQLLIAALELADPDNVKRTNPDWILDGLVPQFDCLVALADRDETRFERALTKLLELRREHYERGDPRNELANDRVSAEALGLIAWARTLGIEVDVECPYTPRALLGVREPIVTACAACLTPLTTVCRACGQSQQRGTRTFEFRAWYSLARAACASCGHRFPTEASTCPVCEPSRSARH